MKKIEKQILKFLIILSILIIYTLLIFQVGAEELVSKIGVENSYFVIFLVAMIGGVSSITSTSFYGLFVIFLYGGSDFVLLSLLSGIGLTIGDVFFYYLGYRGRDIIVKTKYEKLIKKVQKFITNNSKVYVFAGIALYSSLPLPIPTDIVSMSAGLLRFNFKLTVIALLFGNIVHLLLISIFLLNFNIVLIWIMIKLI